MTKAKKIVSYSLDEDVVESIAEMAKRENRSASNLVETILKRHSGSSGSDVDEVVEVFEEFVAEEVRARSYAGWAYPQGHRHWNAMVQQFRRAVEERITNTKRP